jgi:hypothetical protein
MSFVYPSKNTAGNLLVMFLILYSGTVSSITDTLGNTWVQIGSTLTFGSTNVYGYYVKNCPFGTNTVTVNLSGSIFSGGFAGEWSGLDRAAPLVASSTGTGTSAAVNSGSALTPAVSNAVIGFVASNTNGMTLTEPNLFTERASASGNDFLADRLNVPNSSYSYQPTYNTSNTWGAIVAEFRSAPVQAPIKKAKALAASLVTQREYTYYITLERLF